MARRATGGYWVRGGDAIRQTAAKYGRLCFSIAGRILRSPEDYEECVNDRHLAPSGTPSSPSGRGTSRTFSAGSPGAMVRGGAVRTPAFRKEKITEVPGRQAERWSWRGA